MERKTVKLSIYIAIGITIITTIVLHFENSTNILKSVSTIATIAEILIFAYCKWLWRWKFLKIWKIKNINGTWDCILKYKYDNTDCQKKVSITIKQDLFGIQINMMSDETNSYSVNSCILNDHDRDYLIYTYKTETNFEHRDHNRDQWGGAKLLIINSNSLTGEYWTNNKTKGSMQLTKK